MALLCLCLPVAACTGTLPTAATATSSAAAAAPDTEVAQFAAAWQSAKAEQIAALTTDPPEAAQQIGAAIDNLQPTSISVTPGPVSRPSADTARTEADFVWTMPRGVTWKYRATWDLDLSRSGAWSVHWAPTVLHPDLGAAQTLALHTEDAGTGSLVDRNDVQLVQPVRIWSVVALPGKVADPAATGAQLAALLGRYDPTVTQASVVAGLKKADAATGYTVTNLRDADYQAVRTRLAAVKGLTVPSQIRQLPATKDFAKVLLSEVEPVAARMVSGTPGWSIVAVDSTGAELETLASHQADAGSKVTLTLDSRVQQAAEKALAGIPEPAVLVALQPSTGDILAVAQNAAANAQGAIALTGRYPPGSTFKIVTGSAAIDAGLVTPSTSVDCPGVWTVDSRDIHNEGFDLGTVDLTTAFAKSCNTTFARLATELPADALTRAAAAYSIGRDFVVPGITTLTGSVPVADSVVQQAEDGFGQGVVLVTPFSAALMAATVANGSMPTPTLIRGTKTTIDQPAPARTPATRSDLRTLMRAVVTDGTATVLQDAGQVYAKTGTADVGGDQKAHAWTVGFRGDLAFSVLIVNGDTSKRTNLVADAFLKAVPAS
ncbi:penicillin-binding transpeptidase domain-containing protein [Nakamurella endophytica]|uniref:Penicillin-binding protein n=1 Tax=Nakamurella endophytica TaxID=1748367 RepID=A0A917SRL7_9ACTN|nr:penicillin-binding transpeptidase domain-containing protein [Nakamurella endophytica]GGL95589.1 penicillin-binding protein [Nakamurella endophytica]